MSMPAPVDEVSLFVVVALFKSFHFVLYLFSISLLAEKPPVAITTPLFVEMVNSFLFLSMHFTPTTSLFSLISISLASTYVKTFILLCFLTSFNKVEMIPVPIGITEV